MKTRLGICLVLNFVLACGRSDLLPRSDEDNPLVALEIPAGFPELNPALERNPPTKFGVALGERLFHEPKLSGTNQISCATCHQAARAFTDGLTQAVGAEKRVGLRNTPPIQNLAFMRFYNWDGHMLQLERQALIPIITKEEMDSSILEVIQKLEEEEKYRVLFRKAFGDPAITPERIFQSLAQFQYTLISAHSKYDRVIRNEGATFSESEAQGYLVFQKKCQSCHSGALFTDESFRNKGFPLNPSTEEAGRARVTGKPEDYMSFRVPSLRNAVYTAPYGSFGQFPTLRSVLDYMDQGVLETENLDPILQENGSRIPLSEEEKDVLIAFIITLSDPEFTQREAPL